MDAVCFDMDGVLVGSEDCWVALEREEVLPRVCPNDDVPIDEFVSIYAGDAEEIYSDRVELTPGTRGLLTELRDREVPLAMVTSSPPEWYGIVLERFDRKDSFDTVVCSADLDGAGKPEPDMYERAAAELVVYPARSVAVEDSKHGTTSARRARMDVVGFAVGGAGRVADCRMQTWSPRRRTHFVSSCSGGCNLELNRTVYSTLTVRCSSTSGSGSSGKHTSTQRSSSSASAPKIATGTVASPR